MMTENGQRSLCHRPVLCMQTQSSPAVPLHRHTILYTIEHKIPLAWKLKFGRVALRVDPIPRPA